MVGAAVALGLSKQGYRIAIVEEYPPEVFDPLQQPDLRMSAISVSSVNLLESLGAWQYIEAMRVRAYRQLSVWENPHCRTDFTAEETDFEQLGYFVENRLVQLGCHAALKQCNNVTWFSPAKIINVERSQQSEHVRVTLNSQKVIEAQWLIGADGAESQVRKEANIGVTGWQYGQHAMGVVVEFQQPVADITWQQFEPSGPKALLPMYGNFASLIWYDSAAKLNAIKGMGCNDLKQAIVANFPSLSADFTALKSARFPLIRRHASRYITPGVILIGDAAHTINPLAGQGVNLGFKDVVSLLEVTAGRPDISSNDFLQQLRCHYEQPRRRDNLMMMSAMDCIYATFSNNSTPLKWVRNSVLGLAQRAGPLKQHVLKYAMGLN